MSLPTDIEEFVIVGYGPMPRKAVIEAVEELQQISSVDSPMFTYLPVSSVHPKPEFFRAVKSATSDAFYSYIPEGESRSIADEYKEFCPPAFVWLKEELTDIDSSGENRAFLLLMPDGDSNLYEDLGMFLTEALDTNRRVFVMNEGLWEIARVDEDGLWQVEDGTEEQPVVGDSEHRELTPELINSDEFSRKTIKEWKLIAETVGAEPHDLRSKDSIREAVLKVLSESTVQPEAEAEVVESAEPESKPEPVRETQDPAAEALVKLHTAIAAAHLEYANTLERLLAT